jgi:hypothetical protein
VTSARATPLPAADTIYGALLLGVLTLYVLFNYGFMQVRVPPVAGGGVPMAEILLVFGLLGINYAALAQRMGQTVFLFPFLLWWLVGFARMLAGVPAHGIWALRDAVHVIESLFLVVGFAFAGNPANLRAFFRWLPLMLGLVAVYALTFPFGGRLEAFSPTITAGAGHQVALFFQYQSTPLFALLAALYLIVAFEPRTLAGRATATALAVGLMAFTVLLFQARTVYLQLAALFALVAVFRPRLLGSLLLAMLAVLALAALLPVLGVEVRGRLGEAISLEFVARHVAAIVGLGGGGNEALQGAAGGVGQRLGWWFELWNRVTTDLGAAVLGLGYGFPLIDFVAYGEGYASEGQVVREPHNSYVSVLARLGFVGLVAFVWMHMSMLRAWLRAYRRSMGGGDRALANRLLVLLALFLMVGIIAMTEDALEKPFFVFPYYLSWGIVLRLAHELGCGRVA